MSKITKAFQNGKVFIPFITCGDPDMETTAAAVRAMAQNGADIIELGIPFSDPTAEGPVIQAANIRALSAGADTDKVFDLVRELRRDVSVPLIFMTYANVVYSYGAEQFISTCREVGIDGLILPDIPFEEKEEFSEICRCYEVDLIYLIAPTSENRIGMIAREAEGFIYLVSSLGVTGVRSEITTDLASIVRVIRENTDIPVAIGFGISTPEQAKQMDESLESGEPWKKVPFPSYALSNNNQEIHRIEARIKQLSAVRDDGFCGWEFDGGKVVANSDNNRLQLFFDAVPSSEIRQELKSRGFHWSRFEGAWQRQLTDNAIYSASRIAAICPTDGTDPYTIQPKRQHKEAER